MAVTSRLLTAFFLTTALSAPAAAEWSMFGSIEPSTPYDSTWMWPEPGGIDEKKVYFNVLSGSHYPPASQYGKPYVNPNVGALATQIEPFGVEYHVAFLGVWIDCNGDGYLGMAEGGLREYSAELLLDESTCPPVLGSPNTWVPGAHNYRNWVSEFIPIHRGTNLSNDGRVYRDDDVRVWGDFHRPDERPFHRSCALNPQPRGTYQSTGGLVNYVDCRVDLIGPANDAFRAIGDPMGWTFADENDARSGPLGNIPTLGPENDANSPAYFWDCDNSPAFHSGDTYNSSPLFAVSPLPSGFTNYAVMGVAPRIGNTQDPSAPGFVNHTIEGSVVLQNFLGPDEEFDCDTSNDFGHDTYGLLEADFNGVDPNNKIEADWNFGASTHSRGQLPLALVPGSGSGPTGIPQDAGVGIGGTRWVSDSTWASKTGPRTLRVDLESGGFEIAPAYWLSFYARLGADTLALGVQLPRTSDTYGAWHCGEHTSGIHQGWNCDADIWYQNPDGSFPNDPNQILAKPGWTYHMRDVDCYDGRVGDTGVGVQPAFYGGEPCP